jgi:hypothetical protein
MLLVSSSPDSLAGNGHPYTRDILMAVCNESSLGHVGFDLDESMV